MSKVIFVRGIQGSGKTTWAMNWVNEDPVHRIRISWDSIRRMFGKYWVPEREDAVKSASAGIMKEILVFGYDIVIDNMNLNASDVKGFMLMAKEANADVMFVDFKTPLDVCLERNALREGSEKISEDVIRDTYEKYKEFYLIPSVGQES